ncbi:MAG: metallophosphoesterase [Pseudomonadota bacterium]|nr:metallophosphoesterase [Pseudomonadota bacterium]
MSLVAHLSDLHFGRVDERLLGPLQAALLRAQPDLLVVSGDLTQRARTAEFTAARAFLDSLPFPRLVVPGNHDVPLHNVFNRLLRPLTKYRQHIDTELAPHWRDEHIAVFGINTARAATIKDGRIGLAELERLRNQMQEVPCSLIKIVVTHHPLDVPTGASARDVVGRADTAMALFADAGVDLLLAGHLHASHAGSSATRYQLGNYAALVVQAGTATSTRGRGEANSFNLLHIAPAQICVERLACDVPDGGYAMVSRENFVRAGRGWVPEFVAGNFPG